MENNLQERKGYDLLDQAVMLNYSVEQTFIGLAIVLAKIDREETWKSAYDSFAEFYTKELHRSKSDISMLLKVGNWMIDNGLLEQTQDLSYRKLYGSINAYPTETPEFILNASKTLTLKEIEQEKKDHYHPECKHEETIQICTKCKRRTNV